MSAESGTRRVAVKIIRVS
ncbi:hypothetical protein AZE42_10878 [Rhizopogon vesiculosus]|uniref:Uncharacterized protein n=1 Tax=Rhizopogon vesiculosus TaxID=180088 RepID=A0A1J8QZH1_9AGAM|nr:hypothetical protein AZE42_10878 [Rhizopogon vesiculosus]